MAIDTTNTGAIIKTGQQAVEDAANQKKAKTTGKQTTDRGTLITRSVGEMDKNSFLRVMVSQMKNQDPTQNQDSSALVTQMAQFTSMEQLANLNDTMTTNSYQSLIGKGVTMNVADNYGNAYTGIVKGVSKENGAWYLSVLVNENGNNVYKVFDAGTLGSVLDTTDYTNTNMLVNSDFMSASNLANQANNKVVIVTTDSTGNKEIVKGTVKSAYLDNGVVKVRVAAFDENNNASTETKDYPYSSIYKAGDLTAKDMDVKATDLGQATTSDKVPDARDPSSGSFSDEASYDYLNNTKTQPKPSSSSSFDSSGAIESELEKANQVLNG